MLIYFILFINCVTKYNVLSFYGFIKMLFNASYADKKSIVYINI